MDIKLTDEEKTKYDEVYTKITSKYNKEDLELLEGDEVAKYFLKNLIIRYIFTGEMPTDFTINYQTHLGMSNEVHYDASIPLQEKPEIQVEAEVITNEPEVVQLDYDNILSSLEVDKTEN